MNYSTPIHALTCLFGGVFNELSVRQIHQFHKRIRSKIVAAGIVNAILFSGMMFFVAPARAGWEWEGSIESLIITVILDSEKTIGEFAGSPKVTFGWCKGRTAYLVAQKHICFDQNFLKRLARIGDAAVAYVAAHEYAHHLQYTAHDLAAQELTIVGRELQADCFAGFILGVIPNVILDKNDIREMIYAASLIGDQEYDDRDHHGSGEMRALALRSGLRFASGKGSKDNYFKMLCGQT